MGDFADAWRRRTAERRAVLEPDSSSGEVSEAESREAAPGGELSDEEIDRLLEPGLDLASTLTKLRYR